MATPAPVTLYRADDTCALVPHIILTHFDIPFTAVPMRPTSNNVSTGSRFAAADGSLSHEEYLAINPIGFVPTLVVATGTTGSTTITEMPAILTYIASLAPPHLNLLGVGTLEQAKVAEWTAWLSGTLHGNGFGAYLRPGRFVEDRAAFEGVKRRGLELIEKCFARIEERLRGREFAVGDALTVVDFNLYPFWRWATKLEFDMEPYPTYASHIRRLEALDGVRKAVAAEGAELCFE